MELVTGATGSLLLKLGQLVKEEYDLQKGVKKKIQKLSRELEVAQAVLRKIGDVPPEQLDELVRLWARDVREASYDMEDVVDTFLVHVVDAPHDEVGKLRRLQKKLGSLFKKSKARRKISGLIDDINEKLEEVAARRGRYTVDGIVAKPTAATTIDPRVLNLYKRAADLVGIEGPRDELINMLSVDGDDGDVSADKKMKIVYVVGFGGLGKTTLAKIVYDRFKPRFQCGAFVPVGRNPDMKKVIRDILIGLDEEKYTYSNLNGLDENQLMDRLNRFIRDKRCFIVIDDIWDKGSWGLIRSALQGSNCASRFIITTRISRVATHADEVYNMRPLSRGNSEKLLFARIADGEGKDFESPPVEACEKFLKKCSGVPLAIITIASLLANKPWADWSEVYNSIGFGHHEDNSDVSNTRRILSFSYYDLPSHLKACLLYLSVFPEESVIGKNSLIWKWTAEGFITEEQAAEEGVGLFELGERYFNELINRSMIQAHDGLFPGYVDACSVHDMVLDLILKLSGEENFVTVLKDGKRQKLKGGISRRLALQHVEEHNADELGNIDVEKVRSIFASGCDFSVLLHPHLPFLRVVEMVRCSVSNCFHKVMLDHLGSLLHLRYLRPENIIELPKEVRYLRFLQTLDLQDSGITELPEEVGLLTQLVCLRASKVGRVPAGVIGKLRSLQELAIHCPPEDEEKIQFVKELGLLRELRVLKTGFGGMSQSNQSALLEPLGQLHNIQELTIRCFGDEKSWTSNVLFVSYRQLRFLHMRNLVFSPLPASSFSPNLFYLHVKVLAVRVQDMETLARLPQLRSLRLYVTGYTQVVSIKIGTEGVGYFSKLRFLKLAGFSIIFDLGGGGSSSSSSSVPSNNTTMPSLETLQFDVHVRHLKDENPHLGFDKLLGFHNLGISSLQRVTTYLDCTGSVRSEVDEAEAALEYAAAVHPKHPTLRTKRICTHDMISNDHEAYMEVSRNTGLVNTAWKSAEIISRGDIRVLRMPDSAASSSKVIRLLYTDDGAALLALTSKALHKLWKWERSDKNPHCKSSKSVAPVLWQPQHGIMMKNDSADGNPEKATACTAISKNGCYLISASGGKVSLFDMNTFQIMATFMAPPPAASFLAFHPLDNNIIAIGREDSSIQIYNVRFDLVQNVLMGHQKKITGLAFSQSMKMLVSSGADAQLCVWSFDSWEKKKSRRIQTPSIQSSTLVGDTMVKFHYDQTHLLVVHESQLAIYDWKLECLRSWFPRGALPAPISSAVYAFGCLLVYAGFCDGAIGIFEAESLTLQCRIAPSAYLPSPISSGGGSETVYPMVVDAHPWKPNQIALGMSDGAVLVLEPLHNDDDVHASSEQLPAAIQ